MIKVTEAVDQARDQTRDLYKRIQENTSQNHATIRTGLRDSATQAEQLASSLRTVAQDQRNDAGRHLQHAASLLESAASGAKSVANVTNGELRQKSIAMLEHTREALQNVSQAVAAKRSAAFKQRV